MGSAPAAGQQPGERVPTPSCEHSDPACAGQCSAAKPSPPSASRGGGVKCGSRAGAPRARMPRQTLHAPAALPRLAPSVGRPRPARNAAVRPHSSLLRAWRECSPLEGGECAACWQTDARCMWRPSQRRSVQQRPTATARTLRMHMATGSAPRGSETQRGPSETRLQSAAAREFAHGSAGRIRPIQSIAMLAVFMSTTNCFVLCCFHRRLRGSHCCSPVSGTGLAWGQWFTLKCASRLTNCGDERYEWKHLMQQSQWPSVRAVHLGSTMHFVHGRAPQSQRLTLMSADKRAPQHSSHTGMERPAVPRFFDPTHGGYGSHESVPLCGRCHSLPSPTAPFLHWHGTRFSARSSCLIYEAARQGGVACAADVDTHDVPC